MMVRTLAEQCLHSARTRSMNDARNAFMSGKHPSTRARHVYIGQSVRVDGEADIDIFALQRYWLRCGASALAPQWALKRWENRGLEDHGV